MMAASHQGHTDIVKQLKRFSVDVAKEGRFGLLKKVLGYE
jgi:hypothetical protein